MSRTTRFAIVTLTAALAGVTLLAAPAGTAVKLATLAPRNSLWFSALSDMGGTWTKVTEGRVTLTVYPGGMCAHGQGLDGPLRLLRLRGCRWHHPYHRLFHQDLQLEQGEAGGIAR